MPGMLDRVPDPGPLTAEAFDAYAAVVDALGTPELATVMARVLQEIGGVDELFAFAVRDGGEDDGLDADGLPRPLLSGGQAGGIAQRTSAYQQRFWRVDPLYRLLRAQRGRLSTVARIPAADIPEGEYRRNCYLAPGFREKIALAERGPEGWTVLSLFRRHPAAAGARDLDPLLRFARLLLPLIRKHGILAEPGEVSRTASVTALEVRLARLCPTLTARERAVCARSLIGMTAEGVGLDLGIKPTSVRTYRRRAYERLQISSAHELAGLLLR